MNPILLDYLCDPVTKKGLKLVNAVYDDNQRILSGELVNTDGKSYPIIDGVPRFVEREVQKSVDGFGDQWNYFNYDDHYLQWREQTVLNNFDSTDYFKGKTIVDAGAGHGMQSRWMMEAGAKHVIALELSHTVDNIMKKNHAGLRDKIDVIQCSIDAIPLKDNCIPDMVICHNVIQHTPSVEKTAKELWRIAAPGAEFMFNCYVKVDRTWLHRARFKMHMALRSVLQRSPFWVRLAYSHTMAALRFVPGLGWFLEKANLMGRGIIIPGPNYIRRAYRTGMMVTFDGFGSHGYQHHLSFDEQKALAKELQPDESQWRGQDRYFIPYMPIGAALRLTKTTASKSK